MHQQTIRLYEKEGLITPKRSDGNTRLFSQEDVDRLEEVIYLTHQLGINLAGVEMILKLKKQIKKMQKDMNKLFDNTQKELDKESEVSEQIIKTSAKKILQIKHENQRSTPSHLPAERLIEQQQQEQLLIDNDNWAVEYDDE